MADKLTHYLTEAISRAAADPGGVPLYGTRTEPGLFPTVAAAKPAVRKALDDGYLVITRTEAKGKQVRELCKATEKGLRFLLEQVSPKEVLEDFVRALEQREGQVTELLAAASRMADSLEGLKSAVAMILPHIEASRISAATLVSAEPLNRITVPEQPSGSSRLPSEFGPTPRASELPSATALATLEQPEAEELPHEDLAFVILSRLLDWSESAVAGQDCPLPELYRSLSTRETPPTIGSFHDCLRHLHAEGRIYLHPWTGPLYALPEPAYALLAGHNIAYYASVRS